MFTTLALTALAFLTSEEPEKPPSHAIVAEATTNFLSELNRLQHQSSDACSLADVLRKHTQALQLLSDDVDPDLASLCRNLHSLFTQASSVLGNEHADLEAAKQRDRNATKRDGFLLGTAQQVQQVAYQAELSRYKKLWASFNEKIEPLRKRWADLQLQLPQQYPSHSRELASLLGHPFHAPDDTAVFTPDFQATGHLSPEATYRFLKAILRTYPLKRLNDWPVLRRSDTDTQRAARNIAHFISQAYEPGVSPEAIEAAYRWLTFWGYGYSVATIVQRGFKWGQTVNGRDIQPLMFPELIVGKRGLAGTRKLRSLKDVNAFTQKLHATANQASSHAITQLGRTNPEYVSELNSYLTAGSN